MILYPIGSNNNKHKPNLTVIDIIFASKYEKAHIEKCIWGLDPKMDQSGQYLLRSLIYLKNMSKLNLSTISLTFKSLDTFKWV